MDPGEPNRPGRGPGDQEREPVSTSRSRVSSVCTNHGHVIMAKVIFGAVDVGVKKRSAEHLPPAEVEERTEAAG